jgi:hypothetical protein
MTHAMILWKVMFWSRGTYSSTARSDRDRQPWSAVDRLYSMRSSVRDTGSTMMAQFNRMHAIQLN